MLVPKFKSLNRSDCKIVPIPKPGKKKKKRPPGKAKTPEKVIQSQCDSYLDLLGVKPIRIPDSLYRSIYANQSVPIHIKSQISNSIAGLPDLMIPKITSKGVLLLSVEIKTEVGKLGPKQVKWQKILDTKLARNFEEFKELVDNFFKE